jgi:hypothetical protein
MDALRGISRRILAAPAVLPPGSTLNFSMLFLKHDTSKQAAGGFSWPEDEGLGRKEAVAQWAIEYIVFDGAEFDWLPLGRVSLDAERKPAPAGQENSVFFRLAPLNIVFRPKQEMDLVFLLLELMILLGDRRKVPKKEINEIFHVGLIEALSGGGFDKGIANGYPKFQEGERGEGPNHGFFFSLAIEDTQPGVGLQEVNADFIGFLEVIGEAIAFVLLLVGKINLFHRGGITFDLLVRVFHFLGRFKDLVFCPGNKQKFRNAPQREQKKKPDLNGKPPFI